MVAKLDSFVIGEAELAEVIVEATALAAATEATEDDIGRT